MSFHSLFTPVNAALVLLDDAQSALAGLARLIGVTDLEPPTSETPTETFAAKSSKSRRGTPVRRAVVLGAGQSAAEAVDYLHRTFPDAEICSVFGKYGYTPADDSPFANRIVDPEAVDVYYGAPAEVKRSLYDYHRSTNYSVVDLELIEALSRTMYQEKVQGRQRLRMMNVSRIREVTTDGDGDRIEVTVEFLPTGERETLRSDLLVYATGYQPQGIAGNLGAIAKLCLRDEEDELRVGRDHRVETNPNVTADLYLQGGTEHTPGLTSTLLSTTAVRSGEICASLPARRHPAPSRATAECARGQPGTEVTAPDGTRRHRNTMNAPEGPGPRRTHRTTRDHDERPEQPMTTPDAPVPM